jgi:hypothetical protein
MVAVAGFSEDDLSIEFKQNSLVVTVSSRRTRNYHRGIAERSFERRFGLTDHVRVAGAKLERASMIDLVATAGNREAAQNRNRLYNRVQVKTQSGGCGDDETEAAILPLAARLSPPPALRGEHFIP